MGLVVLPVVEDLPGLALAAGGHAALLKIPLVPALPVHLGPGHLFDHRLRQVHHKEAQEEKHREGDDYLDAGGEGDVVQNKLVEKVDGHPGEHRHQGEHVHQGGEVDIGDAAAAGAAVLPLPLQRPSADEIDPFFAVRAGRYSKILHSVTSLSEMRYARAKA